MDKNKILQNFGEEDKAEALNLYEKYELAWERDIPLFGNNFYTPNIWKFFQDTLSNNDFTIESNGVFEEAERKMVSFNNIYNSPFPIKVLKIKNSSKFTNLTHKDYLGAVLALGIRRNKIGDLLLSEDCCYIAVCEDIEEFITANLTTVGKAPCTVTVVENNIDLPSPSFKEEVILIQSLRIDGIVSKLANISRGKAQGIIDEGKVLVDYNKVKSKSLEVTKDERITIRGVGKFILGDIIGNSKSGKFKVIVKKYA